MAVSIFAGCSSSDDDTGKTSTGGTSGSGGSGGTTTGGSGGTQTGGTAGSATGGSAGVATGGSAGASEDCATEVDGQPCSEEGKVCGDCSDPCQFCNLLECENGTWTHMEVFPAPCDGG
jgi:hypothetical protein